MIAAPAATRLGKVCDKPSFDQPSVVPPTNEMSGFDLSTGKGQID